MAVIHHTTLVPGKLELLASWLPQQDWYAGPSGGPELTRAGGFRLDDPDGEVGIEFMIVLDGAGGDATAYLVPLAYRGAPRAGADDVLIGTTEHGVLGTRWVYDGTRDPVVLAQVAELLAGRVQAQAQSQSDAPDPTVHSTPASDPGQSRGAHFVRVLGPAASQAPVGPGQVTAMWTAADGSSVRSLVISTGKAED
jgi:hypothetical protein